MNCLNVLGCETVTLFDQRPDNARRPRRQLTRLKMYACYAFETLEAKRKSPSDVGTIREKTTEPSPIRFPFELFTWRPNAGIERARAEVHKQQSYMRSTLSRAPLQW